VAAALARADGILPDGARRAPRIVASGGSARALQRLERAVRPDVAALEPGVLPSVAGERIREWAERLCKSNERERRRLRGMRLHRADILPVAALTLHETLLQLGASELAICPWGLREGVLIETARRLR
jgi:exopolyphosphatase / guanosine-5'-triphosphate,3'-diphosphate pyrophosphatase